MYFTKYKTLIDELNTYRPTCTCRACSCGGIHEIIDFLQVEYLMDFLMGLNENFSQIKAQLLIMDPLPSISRAFSLILQEEQQRSIGSFSSTTPAMVPAFASNYSKNNSTNQQRRDKPVCIHYNIFEHTVDKCYKIHGYPPRYKTRQQYNPTQNCENTPQSTAITQPNHMLNTTSTT